MADYDESSDLPQEDVNHGSATGNPMERGAGQESQPHKPIEEGRKEQQAGQDRPHGGSAQPAAGITKQEVENQAGLPPRGESKEGG